MKRISESEDAEILGIENQHLAYGQQQCSHPPCISSPRTTLHILSSSRPQLFPPYSSFLEEARRSEKGRTAKGRAERKEKSQRAVVPTASHAGTEATGNTTTTINTSATTSAKTKTDGKGIDVKA